MADTRTTKNSYYLTRLGCKKKDGVDVYPSYDVERDNFVKNPFLLHIKSIMGTTVPNFKFIRIYK